MFEAIQQTLDGSHLDLSFERPESWTRVGEGEAMPPSQWIKLGDPVTGPTIQLGLCPPVPEAMWLDTHYHGSDQLRVAIQGDFQLQRKHMQAGDFGFQVAGIPYREGLVGGGTDALWMFSIQGTWRGARSTNTREDGTFLLGEVAEDQLDRPVAPDDGDYWADIPGGSKGIAALATTGVIRGGFSWGSFADTEGWEVLAAGIRASAAVLGDRESGPAVLLLSAQGDAEIMPACTAETEIVLAVVRGECRIGSRSYGRGAVRIQRAGAGLEAIYAGSDGADIVLMIADRRHMPAPQQAESRWFDAAQGMIAALAAVCGTPIKDRSAMAAGA